MSSSVRLFEPTRPRRAEKKEEEEEEEAEGDSGISSEGECNEWKEMNTRTCGLEGTRRSLKDENTDGRTTDGGETDLPTDGPTNQGTDGPKEGQT